MKAFKNSDGTFNPVYIFVIVTVITFILLFLLCKNIIFKDRINRVGNVVTTTTTTTWDLCTDCAMSFKEDGITMEAGTSEKLKNIMEVKNINISSINFTSSNKEIVSIRTIDGDVSLVALKEVGTVKITATYDKLSIELEVEVKASKVDEADFKNTVYYAYVGKKTAFEFETVPKKAPISLLDLESSDESIGYFDDSNYFIGKEIGTVKITLKQGEEIKTATVHVVKNKITIKVKDNGVYKEMNEFKYPSNIDSYVELCVKIEDNENVGYKQDSIETQVMSTGKIETKLSSEGKYSLDTNSYIFKAHVTIDQTSDSTENYSLITFSLPDGSKAQIKLIKE